MVKKDWHQLEDKTYVWGKTTDGIGIFKKDDKWQANVVLWDIFKYDLKAENLVDAKVEAWAIWLKHHLQAGHDIGIEIRTKNFDYWYLLRKEADLKKLQNDAIWTHLTWDTTINTNTKLIVEYEGPININCLAPFWDIPEQEYLVSLGSIDLHYIDNPIKELQEHKGQHCVIVNNPFNFDCPYTYTMHNKE